MRCSDCHWFKTPRPFGRGDKSCEELGELPQNEACDRAYKGDIVFNRNNEPPDYQLRVGDDVVGTLKYNSYVDIFTEILAESFVLEQDLDRAVKSMLIVLQQQGGMVDMDNMGGKNIRRMAEKLIEMHVAYRVACAIGLGAWGDDIVKKAIEKMFAVPRSGK